MFWQDCIGSLKASYNQRWTVFEIQLHFGFKNANTIYTRLIYNLVM